MGFLEGDEKIFIDGETEPSIRGTGTEDYFNGGFYWSRGPFVSPYCGLTVKDEEKSKIAAYRFHLGDAIPFTKSIKATIEHGETCDVPGCLYSTVAYWYQVETP